MTPSEFNSKLQKLNSSLWVDYSRIAYPYSQEYPTCGLYHNKEFIMGVPQLWVPEYTVSGVDMLKLQKDGRHDVIKKLLTTGFIPVDVMATPEGHFKYESSCEEKLLWRGYKAILASLIRRRLIDWDKAEKIFGCTLIPGQMEFPRNFIQFPHRKEYLNRRKE